MCLIMLLGFGRLNHEGTKTLRLAACSLCVFVVNDAFEHEGTKTRHVVLAV